MRLHASAQENPHMAGKTGKKPTGKKPLSVRRQSAKTDGAFGKETIEQVDGSGVNRNLDKATAKKLKAGG
jgi:hypothetical protein